MQHWNNSINLIKYSFRETPKWKRFLQRYGVVVIANTIHDTKNEYRDFYNKLSEILNTKIYNSMYGDIWDTAGEFGTPTTDTAYTNIYLPPHTDVNYVKNTPKYQIFTSVIEAESGGETVVVDGGNVSREFKKLHPEQYTFLAAKSFLFTCSENLYTCKHKIFEIEKNIIHHNDGDMETVDLEEYKFME